MTALASNDPSMPGVQVPCAAWSAQGFSKQIHNNNQISMLAKAQDTETRAKDKTAALLGRKWDQADLVT
jgi:hypothetical protein